MSLNEHPRVVSAIQDLWASTYSSYNKRSISDTYRSIYSHPFNEFNPRKGFMYIDRVCFRVPTIISESLFSKEGKKRKFLQRSLTPHLDCCPHAMFSDSSRKWRPIQAFIALTDTLQPNEGGFEACLGLHREFDEWNRHRPVTGKSLTAPCVGDFTPIRPIEDKDIIDRFQHIPCRAGDLVCWDYRIPHANSRCNNSDIAREVVYIGLLPDVPLNRLYAEQQLQQFRSGKLPADQWHSSINNEDNSYEFSEIGRSLMAMTT